MENGNGIHSAISTVTYYVPDTFSRPWGIIVIEKEKTPVLMKLIL